MLFYNNIVLKQVWNYYMQAEVISQPKHMAFKTDADALWFGKANPGVQATRKVDMVNNFDVPLSVSISIKGDIAEYISVSDNHFVLQPNETKVLTYYFTSRSNTPYGNYSGTTRVVFTRTFFS